MEGIPVPGKKRYIQTYPSVDLGFEVHRFMQVDISKLRNWYENLEKNYADWKFIYSKHKYMWREEPGDPEGITGHVLKDDTAWYTLCWNGTETGPLPPERGQAKKEFQDVDEDLLYPREIFNGYALDLVNSLPIRSKRWLVTIHTPGTRLIEHQDSPDKIRIHIPIYTNDKSLWVINNKEYHLEPGWAYVINTSLPHSVFNNGDTPRIHLYGKIWIEEAPKLL